MMEDTPQKRRVRGPGKKPAMAHITLRMPRHIVSYYEGNIKRMRDDWVRYVEETYLT